MILQTRELKQQWENASTGIAGDNRKIDLEKIEQLQKELKDTFSCVICLFGFRVACSKVLSVINSYNSLNSRLVHSL